MDFDKTAAYIEQEEGYSPHTYRCTGGALTIGIGYNLDAGMPHDEAQLSWILGFRPDGVLALGSLFHDFYYRHGFLLDPYGNRLFAGKGKSFADELIAEITAQMAGVEPPGRIAQASLTLFGWPAWWGGKKYRDKCAANPGYIELNGDFGD